MMIASGQHRLPGGGAQCGRVEAVELQPVRRRSMVIGGYLVLGSLASYVVRPTYWGSGIGRISRPSGGVGETTGSVGAFFLVGLALVDAFAMVNLSAKAATERSQLTRPPFATVVLRELRTK